MKSIKYRGREAVLVSAVTAGANEYVYLSFIQKYDFGLGIVRMNYDGVFGEMDIKEMLISNSDLDTIESFRKNRIDAEEFAERIQLAQ